MVRNNLSKHRKGKGHHGESERHVLQRAGIKTTTVRDFKACGEHRISINAYLDKYHKGDFDKKDIDTQVDAGWWDWFCPDRELAKRHEILMSKFLNIKDSKKIDLNNSYIWFKNAQPLGTKTYDMMQISDIKTKDVIYSIQPYIPHTGKSEVWGKENGFVEPLVSGEWRDVVKFFYK